MQNWEFLAKNFDNVSNKLIADRDLSRLHIYILVVSYLEEKKPRFIKVMEDDNKKSDQDVKEEPIVADLKKEVIKKSALCKKKRDAQAALLVVLMPESFAPSMSAMPVLGLSTLSLSASTVPMPRLSVPFDLRLLCL